VSFLLAALLRVHLACALTATGTYWLTAGVAKGGSLHRRSGRLFSRLIYATAATGGTLAVALLIWPLALHSPGPSASAASIDEAVRHARQTSWLVLYVLVAILAPVQHGVSVIAAGPTPGRVRSPIHATLNLTAMLGSVLMLPATILWEAWPYLIVTPVGFIIGLRNMTYATRQSATPLEWQREHLTSLISAGIVLHTAFLVLASERSLLPVRSGWPLLVPWIAPAALGLPLIAWWRRRIARPARDSGHP
jgi:hypothetical protein